MPRPVHYLFWFILVFSPLALGGTTMWAKTAVEALCFALILTCLIQIRRHRPGWYALPGVRPLLLLLALPLVQLLPLPPLFLRLISPNSWQVYAETVWAARPGTWMPITLAPKETLAEFFRFAAYGSFYLATVHLLDTRERLKETVSVIAALAGFFALCGGVLFLASGGRILWFLGDWQGAGLTGANQDHFAGFAAMLLPLLLGFFLAIRPQYGYLSLRETTSDLLRRPRSHPHLLVALSGLLLVGALLLSRSVVGLAGCLASLTIFIALLLVRGSRHKKRLWGALVVILALFSPIFFSWGLIWSDHFRRGTEAGRGVWETETVWLDTLNIVGDFPILGAGMGTFGTVYPRYKTVPVSDPPIIHAGNDYLEQLAEGGVVGMALIAWFLLAILRGTWRDWRQRHNRTAIYLYVGGVAGLSALLVHSGGDFVRGIDAFGLYGFFLAGLLVAAAHIRSRKEGLSGVGSVGKGTGGLALSGLVFLLAVNLLFNLGILAAKYRYDEIALVEEEASGERHGMMEDLALQASVFDPLEARYRYLRGDLSLAEGDVETAMKHFGEALRRDPTEAEYLQRIAMVYDNLGEKEKAEALLRAGVFNDRSSSERHKNLAFWLLEEGRRKEGLQHVRQAIFWNTEKTPDFIALMTIYDLEDEQMRRVLPQRAVPLLAYGDYLVSVGKQEEAEKSYREAIEVAVREERPSPVTFLRITDYYSQQENFSVALEIIQAGIERFPENPEFRLLAGLLYEELGISYRAEEEYRRSLILDPENREARERLEKLTGSLR